MSEAARDRLKLAAAERAEHLGLNLAQSIAFVSCHTFWAREWEDVLPADAIDALAARLDPSKTGTPTGQPA